MMWYDHGFFDCETEFRHFWLSTKFSEHPDISEVSTYNPYPTYLVPSYDLDAAPLQNLMKDTFTTEMDGLLFYHKRAHYLPGHTPLVGWLQPYMVPAMFGIDIPEEFKALTPDDYQGKETIEKLHKEYTETRNVHKGNEKKTSRDECMELQE